MDEKKIMVTIDCLTYNHENYIADAIESFLAQKTKFDIEILIHDDASTDGTADIIRQYEKRYPDIINPIYQTENQYSKGIAVYFSNHNRAKGKYHALCEGDDYWTDPYKLQKQVDFLEDNTDLVYCYHDASVLDFNGELINVDPGDDIINTPSERTISTFVRLLTLVFRNKLEGYLKIDFGFIFSGDVALRAYLSTLGGGAYLPFDGAVYRMHAGGVRSSVGFIENYEKWITSRNIILERIEGVNREDVYRSILKIERSKLKYFFDRRDLKRVGITIGKLALSFCKYLQNKT